MEKFKRSFSFRKKKDHVPESHKPHQWQEDERKVRDATCSFQVRYLGCIEVFESRGIQVCEEAVKALKSKNSRSVWSRMSMRRKKKNKENQQCKGKYQRAILYVSGDALRVVDEISKGLIVDQTIEKVSFCAPDRNHEKGFAYICRDGTTRRWMCHGFLAIKETVSGERLSHAVGCAFAICLERKQKREKESVTVTFNDKGTSFTRTGSFRQTTLTERLADPQSAIIAEPVPVRSSDNPHAVQRPHATADMLQRQLSFRGFQKLNESSPFKRQTSLRLSDLPSTLDRQKQFGNNVANGGSTVSTIPEASPTKEREESSISEMCQALTQGLESLTTNTAADDPFASAPNSAALLAATHNQQNTSAAAANIPTTTTVAAVPSHNPWGNPAFSDGTPGDATDSAAKLSEAEFWLNTATSLVKDPFSTTNSITTANTVGSSAVVMTTNSAVVNGNVQVQSNMAAPVQPSVLPIQQSSPWPAGPGVTPPPSGSAQSLAQRAPHLSQFRSHSVDTAEIMHHKAPTLREMSNRPVPIPQFTSQVQQQAWASANAKPTHNPTATATATDPFDAAWAAKSKNNPFQTADPTVTKTFEVNL